MYSSIAVWPQCNAHAADYTAAPEHSVKAAFLYKFAGYVDWPETMFASSDTPITIAVVGDEPIAMELSQIVAGRIAQGHPIEVKRLKSSESVAGIHILFIGRTEAERLERMAQLAQAHSILMVTDSIGALAKGSVINFVLADNRLRFEVSLVTAEKCGLRLSSRLLAVALQVHAGER